MRVCERKKKRERKSVYVCVYALLPARSFCCLCAPTIIRCVCVYVYVCVREKDSEIVFVRV